MKRKNKSKKIAEILIALIVVIIAGISGTTLNNNVNEHSDEIQANVQATEVSTDLKVYFLDVGQADSILIQNGDKNMLIDAGNNKDGDKLVKYFEDLGIKKFDIIVGTHPHEDHIGGLDDIINNFEVGEIYMPKVTTTTATFEDVIDAINNKNLKITTPEIGKIFQLGECNFTIISVGANAEELNETSIVLKMIFGEKTFLFTGDATENNEEDMLEKDIQADVLKVGHHGSKTSTSKEFLSKVDPQYAVISLEKGNSYGHPHKETIEKLENKSIKIYRTDEDGTILMKSDGKEIEIETIKTDTNG